MFCRQLGAICVRRTVGRLDNVLADRLTAELLIVIFDQNISVCLTDHSTDHLLADQKVISSHQQEINKVRVSNFRLFSHLSAVIGCHIAERRPIANLNTYKIASDPRPEPITMHK